MYLYALIIMHLEPVQCTRETKFKAA